MVRAVYVKVIAFFLLSGLMLLLLANTMANEVDGELHEFDAVFSDVSGLRTGDDVRVAGVQVGKVTSIAVEGRVARVGFTLREEQPLLSNSTLVLQYQNLLGQRYLAVVQPPQRGSELSAGSSVPLGRTSPGFDLTALLNGFRPLFDVLEPEDVNKLATSVVKILQGEGGTVGDLLDQTAQLTDFLADRDALFVEVIDNLTPVLNDLAGQGDELRGTIRKLTTFMSGLARHRKLFGRTLDDLSGLIDTSERFLRNVRAPVDADVERTRRLLRMYAAEGTRLPESVDSLGGLMNSLGRVLSYRNALTFYFCDLDLELNGTTAGTSNMPGRHSEVCR